MGIKMNKAGQNNVAYRIALTEWQAEMISKALGYMTLDEEIDRGKYSTSWLKLSRDFDKKIGKEQ